MADTGTIILSTDGPLQDRTGLAGLGALSTAAAKDLDAALGDYSLSSNPLVAASSDLMGLVAIIRRIDDFGEVGPTRAEIGRTVIDLKYRVVRLDYPPAVAENLCLLFSIVIDEFILTSDWGAESGWENLTLVADLFGFRDGGDRFYDIADKALMQPRVLRDFIEIIYIFLKLGYRGRFKKGDDFLRDRLIARLETALDTSENEVPEARFGRPPAWSRPLRVPLRASTKAVAAIAAVAFAIGATSVLTRAETSGVVSKLTADRLAASATGAPVYVYSSQSGKTTVRRDHD